MAQGLPRTIAAVLLAASVVHCSLIAPSDQELMGGDKGSGGDAGRSDAMDGASGGGDGGACLPMGACCSPGECCTGLVCDVANSGVCLPCMQAGGSCFGGNLCCSGNCTGHTCR